MGTLSGIRLASPSPCLQYSQAILRTQSSLCHACAFRQRKTSTSGKLAPCTFKETESFLRQRSCGTKRYNDIYRHRTNRYCWVNVWPIYLTRRRRHGVMATAMHATRLFNYVALKSGVPAPSILNSMEREPTMDRVVWRTKIRAAALHGDCSVKRRR